MAWSPSITTSAEPAGRHVLKLCRAEACQSAGGDALAARAEAKLGIALGETTADDRVTLEPIYCLGLCATAPSAMLDGRVDRAARRGAPRCAGRGGAAMTMRIFIPARCRRGRGRRRRRRAGAANRPRRSAAWRSRSSATARAGCSGWSRWSRSRRRAAASLRPGERRPTSPSCSTRWPPTAPHALRLGVAEDIPWLKRQTRLTFARCGVIDPRSLDDYRAHGGYKGLERALTLGAGCRSSTRSRRPACAAAAAPGFPTGIKWKTVAQARRRPQIHRLQRRRGRQRHLRRPHDHGGRSLRADRGHDHRRPSRSAPPRATSISARNIRTRSRR